MKSFRHLTLLAFGSGLALLAGPLLAQSGAGTSSSAGATAGASGSSAMPGSTRPVDPTTPPYNPTSSGSPSADARKPASPSGTNPVPGTPVPSPNHPYDPTTSNASSATSPGNSRSNRDGGAGDRPTGVTSGVPSAAPWATNFNSVDSDRDGRISLSEFTASPATPGASPANNGSTRGAAGATGTPGGSDTTRSSSATTGTPGSKPAADSIDSIQMFRQLDADRDGYLTHAELEAYRGANPQPR